ncbi:hypothetical protein, partial [Pseudoflavonifractor phocaeensis]|uniref:hypothetical protein n=1 Tax=Pseudoflavonifractor phocaeensis TaxID=1870988 RepID=UPI00195BEEC0
MYFIAGLWYNKPAIKLFLKENRHDGRGEKTYTAAEVAELQTTIRQQQAEIAALKKKLDHMNEIL